VGGGAAVVMGGVFGAIMTYGRNLATRLRGWLRRLFSKNEA
jgi:hypothetical protein